MVMQIRRASRSMTYVKALLTGPSGSGKSYGALLLAQGMLEELPDLGGNSKRIGYIGTESMRDELYADLFDYDIISLAENQKTATGYREAFDAFVQAGYQLIIIDSLTHLWNWVQDRVQEDESSGRVKNSVYAWGKWKKINKDFQNRLLFSQVHVIATARGKDEYVMETDDKGKLKIRKVGIGAQQDKDTEYEFMVSLLIDQKTHTASATKDNSHLWDGPQVEHPVRPITADDGRALMHWALNGALKADLEKLSNLRVQIKAVAVERGGQKNTVLMKVWYDAMNGRSLQDIQDETTLGNILKAINEVAPLKSQQQSQQEENNNDQ